MKSFFQLFNRNIRSGPLAIVHFLPNYNFFHYPTGGHVRHFLNNRHLLKSIASKINTDYHEISPPCLTSRYRHYFFQPLTFYLRSLLKIIHLRLSSNAQIVYYLRWSLSASPFLFFLSILPGHIVFLEVNSLSKFSRIFFRFVYCRNIMLPNHFFFVSN